MVSKTQRELSMRKLDLLIVILCVLLQVLFVIFNITGPIRVVSGIFFVSIWPGYTFLAAFYRPDRQDFKPLEHIALSFPISLCLNVIMGLTLNKLSIAIVPEAHVLWMGIIICMFAIIAIFRNLGEHKSRLRCLYLIVGVYAITLLAGNLTLHTGPPGDENSISLYVLNDNQTINYPSSIKSGTPITLNVGGVYNGSTKQPFRLVSSTGDEIPLLLQPGQEWQEAVEFSLSGSGAHKVEFALMKPGETTPLRSVQLWIEVE